MAAVYDKESFVKNLNGTSVFEINAIVSTAPICCLLHFLFCLLFPIWYNNLSWMNSFIVDNAWLILPNLMTLTALADHVFIFNAALLLLCAVLVFSVKSGQGTSCPSHQSTAKIILVKKQFVSNFRSFMLVATVLSILAVDFKIFPRRYAKTELYGTGFMDIGVGSFIFSHAIVSQFAKGTVTSKNEHCTKDLFKNALGCLPLFFLGALRLIMVKSSGYHQHVTEYGLHWNFFFTIAVVKLLAGTFLHSLTPKALKFTWLFGIIVCLFHQVMLSQFGLKKLVESGMNNDGKRNNLVDANREGIASCPGYIGLFLLSCQLGKEIFQQRSKFRLLMHLVSANILLWLVTAFCINFVDPVSRKLANLTYVTWIISVNVFLLICFLGVELIQDYVISKIGTKTKPRVAHVYGLSPRRPLHEQESQSASPQKVPDIGNLRDPVLVKAINSNQLFYFVVGNLLTGIVNMSMRTIHADNVTGMVVLILYATVTNGLAILLYAKNIQTKFW
ncbi:phosphatidylinositol-glycan biosynthesis class W protein-like [Rhopilema esculentum]|uniref:phosphatidylinositol-glycan biosynthesis class W protein-like n=1 Tax=Rhopilema esculentum TaxID=499914 RepID=UPI0031D5C47D|eukprot:gene4512-20762_t